MDLHKIKLTELDEKIKELDKKICITELINKSVLEKINSKYYNFPVYFSLENRSVLKNFEFLTNLNDVTLFADYDFDIKNLDFLEKFNNLKVLNITSLDRQKISFKKLQHITKLEELKFEGIDNKGQYAFINQQTNLKKLHINKIDLDLIETNENLVDLRVHSTIKSENQIHLKFPNLKKLNFHGCSRLKEHSFISKLDLLEDITINYNSHITHFPKISNPKLLKRVVMLTCPNFCDVESILSFENLETFCLTSYDKPLQFPIQEFKKLKQLKKLKRVYTQFGIKEKDLEPIKKVYEETKWINSMG